MSNRLTNALFTPVELVCYLVILRANSTVTSLTIQHLIAMQFRTSHAEELIIYVITLIG
jgi:hypothetical protein